jgi:hypothetical protein
MSDEITLPYFRPQASRSEPQASEVHEVGGERERLDDIEAIKQLKARYFR